MVVQEDIEPVELETVFVVYDDPLNRLQRHNDDVVDLLEAHPGLLGTESHLQVEPEALDGPLPTVFLTVLVAELLDGYIG